MTQTIQPRAAGANDPTKPTEPLPIRTMTQDDVDAATALHMTHLSHSFFAKIGRRFVRRVYRRLVLSPHGVAFVCAADDRVQAFITAAYDSGALRREFLRKDAWAAGAYVFLATLRRPWIVARAIETLAYGSRTDLPGIQAEMLFISLEPHLRRQGLAIRLICQVLNAFQTKQVQRVKVTTEAVNAPVNQLLASMGFGQQFEFPLHGKTMLLHARPLTDFDPTQHLERLSVLGCRLSDGAAPIPRQPTTDNLRPPVPKIAFISIPLTIKQRYGVMSAFIRQGISSQPPLGLCYIATLLRQHGYDADVIDTVTAEMTIDETIERLLRDGYDYVGMSLPTVALEGGVKIAEALKAGNPKIKILAGGPHPSAMPEDTLTRWDAFDALVVGEGEYSTLELIQCLEDGGDLSKVRGLAFRRNGRVVVTPPRERIADLDSLGKPDWTLLDETFSLYRLPVYSADRSPSFSLFTSRGCIGKCEFCARSVFGRRVTRHSPEYVTDLIAQLHWDHGIRHIRFQDDNFLLNHRWLDRFLKLFAAIGGDITWSCAGRIDLVDLDLLMRLKRSGCREIFYGLESGSQDILDFLQKNITSAQLRQTLAATRAAGMATAANVMLGNPLETRRTLELTRRFVNSIDLVGLSLTFFTPFPGTTIRERIRDYGTFEDEWPRMSSYEPLFVPKGLTEDELIAACRRIYRTFYFRPKAVLNYLRRIGSLGKLIRIAVGAIPFLLFTLSSKPWRPQEGKNEQ